ncbi:hypothetical protein ABGB16_00405 [Micromonospora sp. B11E3]|uniref:hypothetical protein n=1 Tax=Micromonospora sp. B11E3 TaxID=3153562 RepID=UPI00325D7A90
MKTPRTLLVALVVCAALGACGGEGAGEAAPSPSGGTTVTTPPATGSVDPTAPVAPTAQPPATRPTGPSRPPGPGAMTLTGVVEAGVEPGCRLLDGYQLIGGPADVLAAGAKVTVSGQPKPGMLSTCQQGTPFVVESARRA